MGTLINSEDPDEMSLNVTFLQGLHCLLRQNLSSKKETFCGIITCEVPLNIYIYWIIPSLLYLSVWENPAEYKGLKGKIHI